MPIYRILLEPPKRSLAATGLPARSFAPRPPPHTPFFSKTQKVAIMVGMILALGLGARLVLEAQRQHEEELARSHDAGVKIDALLAQQKSTPPDPGKPDLAPENPGDPSRPAGPAGAEEYSFLATIRRQPEPTDGAGRTVAWVRQQAAQRLPALFDWLNAAMQRYSKDNPLVAHERIGNVAKEIRVFAGANRGINLIEGGATRQRNWTDFSPGTTGAIVVDAMDDAVALPGEMLEAADAFAYFYSLPTMNAELRKLRVRRSQR